MDKQSETQQLDAALAKFLRDYEKQSGTVVASFSNWEKGQIHIQVR
ncbi:hypothetical protein [Bacillus solitudinis]|nr:hypothetical protein [Bacillus solitudinis]